MKRIYLITLLINSLLELLISDINAQNIWIQKTNFGGIERGGAVGFCIGTKGYIGMGYGASILRNDFWEYDQGNNTWTQKANFGGIARYGATCFAIGTKGYIGTGEAGNLSTYYNDFWEYDPISNTWAQKANFGGIARYEAIGFAIGSKGYIGTGFGSNYYNDFWEYDQVSNTWTQKANFGGSARIGATGFNIGPKGYIGTGYYQNLGYTFYFDFWEYDQGTNSWTQKANFGGTARGLATGFSIGAKGYIGTGWDSSNTYNNDFWEYDPSLNTWTRKADFGGGYRTEAVGFSIGNKGYIGTGIDTISSKTDFWEYTPDSTNGIEELNNAGISIYPNPLTSSSILQLNTQVNNADVVIYDMVGKELMRKKLTGSRMEIVKGSLQSGVYFVKVTAEDKQFVQKMVVE
jgi:hypothetical protein